jgi:hypothetical protein
MGAQILERFLAEMPSAAPYAREQKPILAELYEGFELLQEGPQRIEGPGEGYSIAFRYVDEEENPSRGRMTFFTCGPLVCQLFLSGPDGDDPERDRLFEAIGKTFEFRGGEFLAGAKAGDLTSEVLRMPQVEAAKGWPGPWRKFPRCCVELPLPTGWEVSVDERDDVVFRRGNAEIRLHRELGENNEADVWFADRMRRLQEGGDRLLGSEQGEIDRGPFAAVLYEERGAVRSWKTAAVLRGLDLFLDDRQPLVWSLRAPESGFSDLRTFFESLIAATSFLDLSEWETRIAEPWLEFTLKGAWEVQGEGVYALLAEEPLLLYLNREENSLPATRVQASIVESIKKGTDLRDDAKEETSTGHWHGRDAFRYFLDGTSTESKPVSIRTMWLFDDHWVHGVFVRGTEAEATSELFSGLAQGVA